MLKALPFHWSNSIPSRSKSRARASRLRINPPSLNPLNSVRFISNHKPNQNQNRDHDQNHDHNPVRNNDFECPNCSKKFIHSHSYSVPPPHQPQPQPVACLSSSSSIPYQASISKAAEEKPMGKGKQREIFNPQHEFNPEDKPDPFSSSASSSTSSPFIHTPFTSNPFQSQSQSLSQQPPKLPNEPPIPQTQWESESETEQRQSSTPNLSSSPPLWSLSVPSESLDKLLTTATNDLLSSHRKQVELAAKNKQSLQPNLHLQKSLVATQHHFLHSFPHLSEPVGGWIKSEHPIVLEELHWLLIGKLLGREGNGIKDEESERSTELEKASTEQNQDRESKNIPVQTSSSSLGSSKAEERVEKESQEEEVSLLGPLSPQDSISIAFQIYLFSLDQFRSENLSSEHLRSSSSRFESHFFSSQDLASSSSTSSSSAASLPKTRNFTIQHLRRSTLHLFFGSLLSISQLSSPEQHPQSEASPFRKASMMLRDERMKGSHSRYLGRKLISMISKDFSKVERPSGWLDFDGKETLEELNQSIIALLQRGNYNFFSSNVEEPDEERFRISLEVNTYLNFLARFISFSASSPSFPSSSSDLNPSIPPSPSSSILATKLFNPLSATSRIKFEKGKKEGTIDKRQVRLFEIERNNRIKEREIILEKLRDERTRLRKLDEMKKISAGFLKDLLASIAKELESCSSPSSNSNKREGFKALLFEIFKTLLKGTRSPPILDPQSGSFVARNGFRRNPNFSLQSPRHAIPISHQIAFNLLLSIPDQFIDKRSIFLFLNSEDFSSEVDFHDVMEKFHDGTILHRPPPPPPFLVGEKISKRIQEKRAEISTFLVEKCLSLSTSPSLQPGESSSLLKQEKSLLKEVLENRALGHSKARWELVPVPAPAPARSEAAKVGREDQVDQNVEQDGMTKIQTEIQTHRIQSERKIWIWKQGNLRDLIKDLTFLGEISKSLPSSDPPTHAQLHCKDSKSEGQSQVIEETVALQGSCQAKTKKTELSKGTNLDSKSKKRSDSTTLRNLSEMSGNVQVYCILMMARELRWNLVHKAVFRSLESHRHKLETRKAFQLRDDDDDGMELELDSDSDLDSDPIDTKFPVKLMNALLKEILKRRPVIRMNDSKTAPGGETSQLKSESKPPLHQTSPDSEPCDPSTSTDTNTNTNTNTKPKSSSSIFRRPKRPSRLEAISRSMDLLSQVSKYHAEIFKVEEETLLILIEALKDWKESKDKARQETEAKNWEKERFMKWRFERKPRDGDEEVDKLAGIDLEKLSEKLDRLRREKRIQAGAQAGAGAGKVWEEKASAW